MNAQLDSYISPTFGEEGKREFVVFCNWVITSDTNTKNIEQITEKIIMNEMKQL